MSSDSDSPFKLDIGCVERDEDRAEFLSACSSLDLRAIRHLIDVKGVDVSAAVDEIGQNCIFFIVCSSENDINRQIQLLGYLTSVGADVNKKRNTDGWTPLFLATIFGASRLVLTLVQNGAKVNIKDSEGLTPEDWAEKYRLQHVKNLLIHSRSKVPHSRFSCVQQGPALEPSSPPSCSSPSSSTNTTPEDSLSTSSTSATPTADTGTDSVPTSSDANNEACLLTAQ